MDWRVFVWKLMELAITMVFTLGFVSAFRHVPSWLHWPIIGGLAVAVAAMVAVRAKRRA